MRWSVVAAVLVVASTSDAAPDAMRPLPSPSKAPLGAGPAYYVGTSGSDTADGSKQAPWKTIGHAVKSLRPGDTLYLNSGIYHESINLTRSGTSGAPITIRSAPNALAVIDAGIPEFWSSPTTAWEPTTVSNEYRSKAAYHAFSPKNEPATLVTGNFGDSMVPLHGYRFVEDFRASNVYWTVKNLEPGTGVYLGPGVWLDPATRRIHVRLTPLGLKAFPDHKGPADPRKVPLVIGLARPALKLEKVHHIKIQDVVLRGSTTHTLHLDTVTSIDLDGVTIYGGSPALYARATNRLRVVNSAVRGSAAPWSSRPSMKYRGNSPYLVVADSSGPQSTDWELAHSEFTDGHDGVVVDSIKKLRFHHNRIDNFNDDALYLTLTPRASVPEDIHVYENVFSRSFTALAFGERTELKTRKGNSVGSGVYVFRNVFDLRVPTNRAIPRSADDDKPQGPGSEGRMCGDHGSPTWEPVFFYQNTVVTDGKPFRSYYGALMVQRVAGSKRRVFNNIFIRMDGLPGLNFPKVGDDLQVDGNLHWGGEQVTDFFAKFRRSKVFEQSKTLYAPGWGASDIYGDPKLRAFATSLDARIQVGSPAVDAGVAIPASWPDSLRKMDANKPDIGAFPLGAPMSSVGLTRP